MNCPVVVNTRPYDQAAELSRLLREAGFGALEVPAIDVVPLVAEALTSILERLRTGEYAWLILPSRNAGRFFPELHGAPIVCGRATAAALGLESAVTLDPFSAAATLEWLGTRVRPGSRILMPRAADGRDELELGLRALGVEVDAPRCYRTRPAEPDSLVDLEHRIRAGSVAVVTVCSPSAVHALSVDLGSVPIVCLGQTTARAVVARGLEVAAVAQGTSMAALVAAVRSALAGVPA